MCVLFEKKGPFDKLIKNNLMVISCIFVNYGNSRGNFANWRIQTKGENKRLEGWEQNLLSK